jgi:hypothetical protein
MKIILLFVMMISSWLYCSSASISIAQGNNEESSSSMVSALAKVAMAPVASNVQKDGQVQLKSRQVLETGQDANSFASKGKKKRKHSSLKEYEEELDDSDNGDEVSSISVGEGEGNSDKRRFECYKCKKNLASKQGLEKHMLIHTGERPFACEKCSKRFQFKQVLERHMKWHEVSQERVACNICKQTFERKNINKHMRVHKNTQKKINECDKCGKQFNIKDQLVAHMRTQKYKLDKCKNDHKSFSSSQSALKTSTSLLTTQLLSTQAAVTLHVSNKGLSDLSAASSDSHPHVTQYAIVTPAKPALLTLSSDVGGLALSANRIDRSSLTEANDFMLEHFRKTETDKISLEQTSISALASASASSILSTYTATETQPLHHLGLTFANEDSLPKNHSAVAYSSSASLPHIKDPLETELEDSLLLVNKVCDFKSNLESNNQLFGLPPLASSSASSLFSATLTNPSFGSSSAVEQPLKTLLGDDEDIYS